MSIEHPVAFLVCVVMAALWAAVDTWLRVRRGAIRPPRMAFRLCIFILLVAAAAGLILVRPSRRVARVVVLDRSASTLTDEAGALDAWQDALANLRKDDLTALVVFGARPSVEIALTRRAEVPRLTAFHSPVDSNETDIAAALSLANALLPDDAVKQIVLVSDGRVTRGDAWREVARVSERGVRLWTVPLGPDSIEDVRIVSFSLPVAARPGEPVELRVAVASTFHTRRTLEIRDAAGQLLAEHTLAFSPGSSRDVVLTVRPAQPGLYTYAARVIEPDDVSQNNERRASVWVAGEVLVRYVRATENPLGEQAVRHTTNVTVRPSSPQEVQPGELLTADLVVLDDIPIEQLSGRFVDELSRAMKDFGTGLVVLGGPNSYGPGGYAGSALEELLPVWCDPRPEPGSTLVIVLDKSGSMADTVEGGTKFRLAQQAVLVASTTLRAEDQLAVIVFDVNPILLVPIGSPRRKAELERVLNTVFPSGGTALGPALQMATEVASASLKPDRHILLLSDGRSLPFDAEEILQNCREGNLAISVVATGEDADVPSLTSLAVESGGRFYRSETLVDIREIFAREARFSMQSLIREQTAPVQLVEVELIRGISADRIPPVEGYVLTRLKERASAAFLTESDAPLLAFWTVGLGRMAALTSGADAGWLDSWVERGTFSQLVQQVVRWTARPATSGEYIIEARYEDGRVHLVAGRLEPEESESVLKLQAEVFSATGTRKALSLARTGVNRFEGSFEPPSAGTYVVRLHRSGDDEVFQPVGAAALAVQAHAEWQTVGVNRQALASLAAAAGGWLLKAGEAPEEARLAETKRSISEWLIAAALVLFVVDVALFR